MPTVTAIALDALLEPGSSSASASDHHHHRGTTITNKASHSPVKDHRRRSNSNVTSTSPFPSSASSPKAHNDSAGRSQQPPVSLSRQQRCAFSPATSSESNGAPRKDAVDVGRRNGQASAAGARTRLCTFSGYYISPKLYAVPGLSTRIGATAGSASASSSTADFSPSPYVVNHKRRGISLPPPPPLGPSPSDKGNDSEGVMEVKSPVPLGDPRSDVVAGEVTDETGEGCGGGPGGEVGGEGGQGEEGGSWKLRGDEKDAFLNTKSNGEASDENTHGDEGVHNDEEEEEDFFNPGELTSAGSSSDTEYVSSFCRTGSGRYPTTPGYQSEYYDASEEFFSEGSVSQSSPSSRANIEADLCSMRLNLLEEIDRRKRAEEDLALMQNMFQRIARQLFQVGLPFPPMQPGGEVQYDVDTLAQLCQELVVTRFVFEAVEIGLAHAEAQAAAEAVIQAKNHEIARLRDRLQYYEAMNCEMSQRNQAAIELARHRRLKRKVWRRWVWGCGGLLITAGTSLLAYSYLAHGCGNPSLASNECHDSSSETVQYGGSPM